ncbi:hypothetical protein MmiEs2_09280 [Methanimicrococcus stummii]|uniref:Uncharacterized protein n=1 Tax=Methanimicrococcus stummii TaxID=3028294 RepID=A0AA96VAI4_9EURY|nr:hypothetical protein [Methanimicrococcus sp. Es2]WNY28725.1 hypothetical protein MmiEs2_09280 [Methanimicrococcus sp. Es2]
MAEITKNKPAKTISRLVIFTALLMLLLSSALPAGASESDTSSYFSEEYIQDIINNTPATDVSYFKQASLNADTIAVFGTLPAFSKGRESYEWFVLLQGVTSKLNEDGKLAPYLWDNGGFIIGYGYQNSVILISIHSEYSDEEMNAVIQIIEEAGQFYGISDIPIIIEQNTHAQAYTDNAEPEKTIPGVGLAACALLSLFVVLFIRKSKN